MYKRTYSLVLLSIMIHLTVSGCMSTPQAQQDPSVRELADNTYRITLSGPAIEGKLPLETGIYSKAESLCGDNGFEFDSRSLGQKIRFKSITEHGAQTGWHNNNATSIVAVATIICSQS